MTKTERPEGIYTLWGGPLSLYSGKARSYLIKKRIPYVERFPSHRDFPARVMPAIGLFVVPVLEAPDGTLVRIRPAFSSTSRHDTRNRSSPRRRRCRTRSRG